MPFNAIIIIVTLPDAWHCRVSSRIVWPIVNVLRHREMASLIYKFCLSVDTDNGKAKTRTGDHSVTDRLFLLLFAFVS